MPVELQARPWVSSGVLTGDSVIKNLPGVLGAVMIQATDNGTDHVVKVYDSPNDTLTDDVIVYQCDLPEATDGARQYVCFPVPGIKMRNGIYVDITGDLEYEIYYR